MQEKSLSDELLQSLAEEYGTPLYVYHADKIRYQYKQLFEAFSIFKNRIFYASKALTNVNIINLLYQEGADIDCVSINEIKMATQVVGVVPDRILYTPSCPNIKDIDAAIDIGVHVHIDTLSVLEQFGKRYGNSKPIGIRINPELPPSGGHINISTAHVDSKFGIPISYLDTILDIVHKYQICIVGLHQHTGSDVKDSSILLKGFEVLTDLIRYFPDLTYVDIGGGFKVPYHNQDIKIDLVSIAQDIKYKYDAFSKQTGHNLTIWVEPGKYFVSQSGYLLTRVNTLKNTPTKNFIVVDTGFHHLVRPMMYGAYHYIDNLSNPQGKTESYDIVGILCETDTFAEARTLNQIRENDILSIYNAGAYGFEMSSNFNAQLRPAEVLVDGNQHQLIRKRDTFERLLDLQVVHFNL